MAYRISRVEYYYATVEDEPGAACAVLSRMAELGVSLVAFAALPLGPTRTQLTLFPEDGESMKRLAGEAGMTLDGPHPAILLQGDDELGALVKVHAKLADAGINVYASTGVTDGCGDYGYIVYVRAEQIDEAMAALRM